MWNRGLQMAQSFECLRQLTRWVWQCVYSKEFSFMPLSMSGGDEPNVMGLVWAHLSARSHKGAANDT